MGLFGLFSGKDAEPAKKSILQSANAGLKPAAPKAPPAVLCRTEIVDAKNRLCGYRFRLQVDDGKTVGAEADYIQSLVDEQIPAFAERRLAFVKLGPDAFVFNRHTPLLAANLGFEFDRREVRLPAPQLAARFEAVRDAGAKAILLTPNLSAEDTGLWGAADIIVLDLANTALPQFQMMVRQLRANHPKVQIAADNVDSWDEQRMCLSWGVDFCLGPFLTKPDKLDENGKIDQGRLTSIELLNLLRADAELDALAEVAKRDPGLTFQLLKWANAPSNGQQTTITSLAQAIVVLGRSSLYRWLTVSMFRLGKKNRERDESLLEVALTRARFLETVCEERLSREQRDEMFLVGLLSLFDILLGMPMPRILEKMQLSQDVLQVLLSSRGPYSPYMLMALQLERGLSGQAADIALKLEIDPDTLDATSKAAFRWAQESMQQTMGE